MVMHVLSYRGAKWLQVQYGILTVSFSILLRATAELSQLCAQLVVFSVAAYSAGGSMNGIGFKVAPATRFMAYNQLTHVYRIGTA